MGDLGRDVHEALDSWGGEHLEVTRTTSGVEAKGRWRGQGFKVECLEVEPIVAKSPTQGSDPFFLLMTLGVPDDAPRKWAVVTHGDLVAQVAGGDQWLQIGTPLAMPEKMPLFNQALDLIEKLNPEEDEDQESDTWQFRTFDEPSRFVATRALVWGGIVLSIAAPLSLFVSLGASSLEADSAAMVLAVTALLSKYSIPLGLILLLLGWSTHRATVRAHDQGAATVSALRSLGLFKSVGAASPGFPQWPPLVTVQQSDRLILGGANLETVLFQARAGGLAVDLRVKLHKVAWPVGAVDAYRLLPDSWAAVELTGPADVLSRVPAGPREHRDDQKVRWLFSGRELDRGELARQLTDAAHLMSAATQGPYR